MTLAAMLPRPEQEEAIQAVLRDKAHICRGEVGAGKTLIGVEAVLRSGVKQALIVAPLNTFSSWKETFERQYFGVTFKQITNTAAGKQTHADLMNGVPGIYFIGWAYFRRFPWAYSSIEFVIADECHRMQNRKSATALMADTTIKAEYKLSLSATPAGNRLEGLWQNFHWLWPEETPAYWTWITKYFHSEMQEHNGKKTKAVLGERVPGTVWNTAKSKSYFPSPYQVKPTVHEVRVKMTAAQQKIYDRFEQEAVVWLEENPLIADLPAIQAMRLREITLAVPSIRYVERMVTDEETGIKELVEVEEVYYEDNAKSSKADAILEVLEDLSAGGPVPVLMLTHSRKFATLLTKRLQAKGYRARQFVGGMSAEERAWKKEAFGHEYEIMVATIGTVGEGTDGLQKVCNIEFWVSVDDNRVLNQQAAGRIPRPGQTKQVQRYYFRADASVETRQISRLATDEALLNESLQEAVPV